MKLSYYYTRKKFKGSSVAPFLWSDTPATGNLMSNNAEKYEKGAVVLKKKRYGFLTKQKGIEQKKKQ